MNPLQLSARYLKGYGANRGIQEAVDYGLGAAIGAGGQQLMNWTTQGADPNPLLSGALFSPVGAALVRSSRGLNAMGREITRDFTAPSGLFSGDKRNLALLENQLTNPYTQAALAGSLAGAVGGAGTSIYNTLAGGDDVDNNLVAAGVGTLGAIAPIAYSLMKKGRPMVNESVGNSRNPINPKTGYQSVPEAVVTSKVETPQPQKRPFDGARELEGIKRYFYGDSIGNSMMEPKNPKTGYYEDAVEGVTAQTTSQPRYSRNPSRIDLATGTYSRNPSRIIL